MFSAIVIGVALTLVGLGVAQVLAVRLLRGFTQHAVETTQAWSWDEPPRVAVLLAVRGLDPHLVDGLRALLGQDYERYAVHVVVDHREDPAWPVVNSLVRETTPGRLRVWTLEYPRPNCGLKCSAHIESVERLLESSAAEERPDVLVMTDADVLVDPHWLSQLVAPLADPKVGLVTGTQWFEPHDVSWGSWLRSIWNSGACVPTILLGHPWAGSCALRLTDVQRSGLLQRWSRSMVDDGPLAEAMHELGLRIQFQPAAWMVNRERCTLGYVFRYLTRMLTWSRLYESTYGWTLLHAVGVAGLGLAGLVLGGMAAVAQRWDWMAWAWGGLGVFWILSVWGYVGLRRVVETHVQRRGSSLGRASWGRLVCVGLGIPMTYALYAVAAIRASMISRIRWRGIEYEVERADRVRLVAYYPIDAGDSSQHSLG